MNNYNLSPSKRIVAGILLLGSHTLMSCFNANFLDEQTKEATGEKLATCYDTSLIVPSDNGVDTFKSNATKNRAPHLANAELYANIPDFWVINEGNETSKTRLLEDIDNLIKNIKVPSQGSVFTDNNKPRINVLLREPDYPNSKINPNSYNKSNPNYFLFLTEEGRLQLVEELKKYCEWKKRNKAGAISSRLENTLKNEAIYKHIKEKIDEGLVPESTDQRWQEEIWYLIDSYRDYCTENYNINEPDAILAQACSIYIKWNKALLKRYQSLGTIGELYSFYCEKEKKDRKEDNTVKAFLAQTKNSQYMDGLVNFYIQEKLKRLPPWEEINAILEKYKLPYKVDYTVDSTTNAGTLILIKTTQGGTTLVDLKALSSEERLMLDLMSWLFYFPELSAKDKKPVQIKNIVVRLLDESSRQLDPELCKKLYEVIYHEFVQKRQTRVIVVSSSLKYS